MTKAFLSHSSKDKERVKKFADALKLVGIDFWIDEAEIKIGDSLIDKISKGVVKETDCLIAFISSNSVNSHWVQKELSLSMTQEVEKLEVRVYPVLLDDCELPPYLLDKVYADFRKPENEANELAKLIRSILQIEVAVPIDDSIKLEEIKDADAQKNIGGQIGKYIAITSGEHRIIFFNRLEGIAGGICLLCAFTVVLYVRFIPNSVWQMYILIITSLINGICLMVASSINESAYQDRTYLMKIEKIGGWNLPFDKTWRKQIELKANKKTWKMALYLETIGSFSFYILVVTFVYLIMHPELLFPSLAWMYR